MRSRGYTHPLSVLQIRTDLRNKCNKMKQETLLDMLTPEGIVNSSCVVVLHAQFSVSHSWESAQPCSATRGSTASERRTKKWFKHE